MVENYQIFKFFYDFTICKGSELSVAVNQASYSLITVYTVCINTVHETCM